MSVSLFVCRASFPSRIGWPSVFVGSAVLVMLAFIPVAPAFATDGVLRLQDAVEQAVTRAPILLARDASRTAASEDLVRADALPDPTLAFGIQSVPINGPDAFTVARDGMTMRHIGVSQALPSRAKREARREMAQALLAQADAQAVTTVLDVKRATATAWVQMWAAQEQRRLLQDLSDQAALAVRATRARLSGGTGSASDALAARGTDLQLQNRIDDAESRIEQARAGLQRWLGEAPTGSAAAPPDFSQAPVPEARLLANLDRQGPLLSWDAQEASAEAALTLARAEKRPDWSVGAGVARRGAGASNVAWLEIGIGLPLFAGNRQDRGVAARNADLQSLHASREDARRMQGEAVRKAFVQWQGIGRQIIRSRDTLLPLSSDRSSAALAAYSGGASLQDWLDARRDEIDARLDYADLLAAWGQAWVELAYLLPDANPYYGSAASTSEITR